MGTIRKLPSLCVFPLAAEQYQFHTCRQVKCSAVPSPPKSKGDASKDFQDSGEEVIGGCRLTHGILRNGSVKLHYVECGDPSGQLVLLLHGFPNFWYVWVNQFKALSQAGYHVIAPDLRGFNASDKPEGVKSYGRQPMESDVLQFIDQFGRGRPVSVVGHDWGALLSWALAEDHPEKLERVVIVNVPLLSVFGQALRSDFKQFLRSWYIFFFQIPVIPELVIQLFRYQSLRTLLQTGACKPLPEEGVDRHVQAYSKPGAVTSALNLYRAAFSGLWGLQEKSTRILLPVLIIWGEQDQYLRKELCEPPKDIVPHATIARLPKASHWPMWDEPDTFNNHLLQFLDQNRSKNSTS